MKFSVTVNEKLSSISVSFLTSFHGDLSEDRVFIYYQINRLSKINLHALAFILIVERWVGWTMGGERSSIKWKYNISNEK